MSAYTFTSAHWPDLASGQQREWSVQNGAGGYAGCSLRRHHGWLIASLTAPVQRQMVWTRCEELLACGDAAARLDSALYQGAPLDSTATLRRFRWDGLPGWSHEWNGIQVRRGFAMQRACNTSALAYTIENTTDAPATLTLTPCVSWRGAGDGFTPDSFAFRTEYRGGEALLYPAAAPEYRVRFGCIGGELQPLDEMQISAPIDLRIEIETGDPRPEKDAAFFRVLVTLPARSKAKVSLTCALEASDGLLTTLPDAFALIALEKARIKGRLQQAGAEDTTTRRLVRAADQFLVYRHSTDGMTMLAGLPWFTDWGRDTMIAFEGNCLCTRRFADARSILETFARYERKGLVPNMFPDAGTAPLYNTVDGSMWYVNAVGMYLQYTGADEDYTFVQSTLWPCIRNILHYYEAGTDFSIGMDKADCLVHAGGGLDQVTWMDIRVGDWVPTPRHGKPVEINALWYTALCIGEQLARRFGEEDNAAHWADLAAKVQVNFAKAYWVQNDKGGYLCDVIEYDGRQDDTLRPNQLMAVSLRRVLPAGKPPLLTDAQQRSVVQACEQYLWAGPGMRTLPTDHPDYHGIYFGKLADRDAAYHQGTAWGWLLGEFLMAHHTAYGDSAAERAALRRLIAPALASMRTGGVNCIAEIFDGNAPHENRGCFNQAWSIGTVLAAWRNLPGLENA